MKKLMSVVMAVVFLCAIALPVFAAETPSPDGQTLEAENGVTAHFDKSLGDGVHLVVELASAPDFSPAAGTVACVIEIHVEKDSNGEVVPVEGRNVTISVPKSLLDKQYQFYQVVFVPQPEETHDVVVEGDLLKFTVSHFSQYAIVGSDTPFEAAQTPGTQAPGENGENTSPVTESFVYMMAIAAAAVVCVALAVVTARKASKSK